MKASKKCPYCRAQIQNSAINRPLLQIISKYTNCQQDIDEIANNFSEEQGKITQEDYKEQLQNISMRIELLIGEMQNIKSENTTLKQKMSLDIKELDLANNEMKQIDSKLI
eukprot:CAMPEP_0116983248 /NCGR_PEP_ID=MMETSP0467-20121206/60852_1 /TAXON_ID=283647 /ORGANISM="Mesodinium pulex, Strain SPMC105" /LENGTH=110 /DNA_ID=CAMNT_0004677949 /DNA_START=187 /DNA_END=519 /DNA_ORIENTATION=+